MKLLFKPKINKAAAEIELSACDEFVPANSIQENTKGKLTEYEKIQLELASRKLDGVKQKFKAKISMKRKSMPGSGIRLPDSLIKHTKAQLDTKCSNV